MATRRTLVLLCLSITFASVAAWLANNWLVSQQAVVSSKPVESEKRVKVVVAALNLPNGQAIEARHLKLIEMPESAVPPNSFSGIEALTGMVTIQPLLANEVIRHERVSDHLEGTTFAALIDPEMRAFTVRVNDVVGVAGFLLPGNRVDVIATRKADERTVSETALRDLKVLAVDQHAKVDKSDPVVVRAVTLEVTPAQAEKLARVRDEGRIQLTLRNPLSKESTVVKAKPKQPPQPQRRLTQAQPRVIVIKGTDWQRKSVPM